MFKAVFIAGITVFTAVIFGQAGFSKLRNPRDYRDIMATYLNCPIAPWMVLSVGAFELVLGLAVMIPATRVWAALGCGALLLAYALFMWRQTRLGRRDLRCGCSGPAAETRVSSELVVRNVVVAVPVLSLALAAPLQASWALAVMGMAWGLGLLLLYVATDQIIANRQRMAGWIS